MNQSREEDISDIESLIAAIHSGVRFKYIFFWGHQPTREGTISKSCFSQWWPSPFTIDDVAYATAEHYMMAEKARLFGDEESLNNILKAPHPGAAKNLGRGVIGFDEEKWKQHRFDVVVRGNWAKFDQNALLKQFLLNTRDRILVEASPIDRIWGIGLGENDPQAQDPERWRGLNLLGFALMAIRSKLGEEKERPT